MNTHTSKYAQKLLKYMINCIIISEGENMKKFKLIITVLLLVLLLTSCFPGKLDANDDPAGFFWGIWHGWIAPVSLIISIGKDHMNIFEMHNSGFLYNLGFYMGIVGGFGGIALSRKRKKDD